MDVNGWRRQTLTWQMARGVQIFELNGLGRKQAMDIYVDLSQPTVTEVETIAVITVPSPVPNPANATLDHATASTGQEVGGDASSCSQATLPEAAVPAATPKVLATSRLRDITNSTPRHPSAKPGSPSKRNWTTGAKASVSAIPGPVKTPARFATPASQLKARGVGDRCYLGVRVHVSVSVHGRPLSCCPASAFLLPSLPFPSLPFPSLPFPSLPFPSLPFPSLSPFHSLPPLHRGNARTDDER